MIRTFFYIGVASRREPFAPTERKEVGPNKADWGQTWPSLGLSSRSPLGPNLDVICAELGPVGSNLRPTGAQNGAIWALFVAAWAWHAHLSHVCSHLTEKLDQDRRNVGSTALHEHPSKLEKGRNSSAKMQVFTCCDEPPKLARVGPNLGPAAFKGAQLGSTWDLVALSWT